jgi:hypothetical protein
VWSGILADFSVACSLKKCSVLPPVDAIRLRAGWIALHGIIREPVLVVLAMDGPGGASERFSPSRATRSPSCTVPAPVPASDEGEINHISYQYGCLRLAAADL